MSLKPRKNDATQGTPVELDEEHWGTLEDRLLDKPHEGKHALRRWKYFSK